MNLSLIQRNKTINNANVEQIPSVGKPIKIDVEINTK